MKNASFTKLLSLVFLLILGSIISAATKSEKRVGKSFLKGFTVPTAHADAPAGGGEGGVIEGASGGESSCCSTGSGGCSAGGTGAECASGSCEGGGGGCEGGAECGC